MESFQSRAVPGTSIPAFPPASQLSRNRGPDDDPPEPPPETGPDDDPPEPPPETGPDDDPPEPPPEKRSA